MCARWRTSPIAKKSGTLFISKHDSIPYGIHLSLLLNVICIVNCTADAVQHVESRRWFAGGATFAFGLVAAGTLLTRRFLYPNPETVLVSTLPKLRASREVCALVGRKLEPGLFRAYSRYGGAWKWVGPPTFASWKPREYY